MRSRSVLAAAVLVLAALHTPALAQPAIRVSAFNPPSLGSYIPPVIKLVEKVPAADTFFYTGLK